MDLEDIMLSVISQTDKDKYQKTNIVLSHLYVKSRKTNKQMKQNRNRHRYREQTSGYQKGEAQGEGIKRYKLLGIKKL